MATRPFNPQKVGQHPDFLKVRPKSQIPSQKPVAVTGHQRIQAHLQRTKPVQPLSQKRFRQLLSKAQHFPIIKTRTTGYSRDPFLLDILKAFSTITHTLRYPATTHLRSRRLHFRRTPLNYPQTILQLLQQKQAQTLFIHLLQLNNYNPTHTSLHGPRIHNLRPYLAPMSRPLEASPTLNGIPSQHQS